VKSYSKTTGILALAVLQLMLLAMPLWSQEFGARLGTVKRGGKVTYEPTGPGVLFDALDPAVQKWYVPQELFAEYQWKQWEYSNYARQNYQRYVNTSIEGNYFYDVYGNFLTRGWLIFDWRQQNPQPFGSTLIKDGRFGQWFNSLVVASDHKGQYHYAITVGNEIRTTLTPMTFSKPRFNGVQIDLASDKYRSTIILSRISAPNLEVGSGASFSPSRTDNTNLAGGRLEVQVGDFVKVGGTLVNARHSHTTNDAFGNNLLEGNLVGVQNLGQVSLIEVVISDDSPEDGVGGGALFDSDIVIRQFNGETLRGSEIGFRAQIEGGFQRRGFLAADGTENITLRYDFFDRSYTGPDASEIKGIEIELVLANDYRVDVVSNRQIDLNNRRLSLPVARAAGNVRDGSNQRVLRFDYGLPTANQIAGFTVEVDDLAGLKGYLEVDINQRFRQYPNPNINNHRTAVDRSEAIIANLSKVSYPFFAYGEAFNVDAGYTTSLATVDINGFVNYSTNTQTYEFVDDNDDQDRLADWPRKGGTNRDREVFPGWDQNNDFISDFNQNDSDASPNLVPDYEEPFLRYRTDRPEFLYGVDMNHNGTIDRFENDEEADYPYKRDRRGYNAYGGFFLGPDARLTVGRLRTRQLSEDRVERASYLIFTAVKQRAGLGWLRLFQDLRQVKDTLPNNLLQWVQPPNSRGELQPVEDRLEAPDTWINTSWLGFGIKALPGLDTRHTVTWRLLHQRSSAAARELSGLRRQSSFFGMVHKAEYSLNLGNLTLRPAWKNEFRHQTPAQRTAFKRREMSQLFFLTARFPVLRNSYAETGLEYHGFHQLENPTPPGADDNFSELTALAQLTNVSEYQGYLLTTVIGFDITRRDLEVEGAGTRTRGFLTIYAGVER
jgi:hypothetical protein